MTRSARRSWPFLLALVLAVGWLAVPGGAVSEVRAATPDLTITSDAKYTVQPDKHRVRVSVVLTLTNRLTDTKTKRYYFDRAYLAVLPGSSAYRLRWAGSGTPAVRATEKAKDYTILRLDLAKRLYGGKTATYTLSFDLVDKGGKATRDLRVGDSLVSFPVWAYASDDTPGSSVTVVFPKGFVVDAAGGSIPKPTVDDQGRTIFRSGRLAKPLSFFAFLIGDRPGAYKERTVTADVQGEDAALTIRAWPDDPAWDKRVGGLMERGLPALGELIGEPWRAPSPLTVQEAVSRSTNGYAGLFDPTKGLVEVAYYATDFVVLHEAAHAWFNGSLLADRWANEGFASYYGLEAAAKIKVKATGERLTDDMADDRIPLNAWGAIGREPTATEDYAYAAALELARAIAERAGPDGLRKVWDAAAARRPAYQPTGVAAGTAPAGASGSADGSAGGSADAAPPDWRGLLDLLEDDTSATYDDLWRTWVAREEDLPLLDARLAARERYAAVVADAGSWQVPVPVLAAMRAWQFEDASVLLDQASAVLEQRAVVIGAATAAGLTPPETLRLAFEDDDGFEDAGDEAAAELETIARYREAVALRPEAVDGVMALGLWGEDPERALVTSADAFADGDLAAATSSADRAAEVWAGATSLGQGRAISLALLAIAAFIAVLLLAFRLRGRRRRRRRSIMQAHRLEP